MILSGDSQLGPYGPPRNPVLAIQQDESAVNAGDLRSVHKSGRSP